MLKTILMLPSFVATLSFASTGEITGIVTVSKDLEKTLNAPEGVLFVIAKKAGAPAKGTPPSAVVRIPKPKFPQAFKITSENSMMGGDFKGPFTLTARYSPTGDAMDKSGPEGTDPKASSVEIGAKDIKLELKKRN